MVRCLNTKGDVVMCDGMRAGAENDEVPVSLLCVAATSVEMEYGAGPVCERSNVMHAKVGVEIYTSRRPGWGGDGCGWIAAMYARARLMTLTDPKSGWCGSNDGSGWPPVV